MSASRLAVRLSPLLVLVLCLSLLLGATTAAAQEATPRFKSVKVSIWPEYDAPRVLVFYEAELADNVSLPATVRFTLPPGAEVSTACAIDENGQHIAANLQQLGGESPAVSYVLNKRATHVDFYFQPIEGGGRRDIAYTVRTPGATDVLQVEVQQPLRASNFSVQPAATSSRSDAEGFAYQRYDYTGVAAGAQFTYKVAYEKPDAEPSVQPETTASTPSPNLSYAVPLVLLGLGATVLGTYYYTRGRRPPARPQPPSNGRKGKRAAVPAARVATAARPAPRGAQAFCTQCGTPVRAGAAFCSACGQPLRRSS